LNDLIVLGCILVGALLLNLIILYIANAFGLVKVNSQCEKLVDGIKRNSGIIIFCASIGTLFYVYDIVSSNSKRYVINLIPWFGIGFILVAGLLLIFTLINCLYRIPKSTGNGKSKIFIACLLCILSTLLGSAAIVAASFYGFSLYDHYQIEIGGSKTAIDTLFSILEKAKALIGLGS